MCFVQDKYVKNTCHYVRNRNVGRGQVHSQNEGQTWCPSHSTSTRAPARHMWSVQFFTVCVPQNSSLWIAHIFWVCPGVLRRLGWIPAAELHQSHQELQCANWPGRGTGDPWHFSSLGQRTSSPWGWGQGSIQGVAGGESCVDQTNPWQAGRDVKELHPAANTTFLNARFVGVSFLRTP